jgi:hypothetical protein
MRRNRVERQPHFRDDGHRRKSRRPGYLLAAFSL